MAASTTTTVSASSESPSFASSSEELSYWRDRALCAEHECRSVREELDEFQESSRELEQELEMQLEQTEAKRDEYRSSANRLQLENDELREKLEQSQREYNSQVSELQTELAEIKDIREQLSKYVRDLEQQNDDLQRAKRSLLASVEDFESRLNAAVERNALLESELDEKESLKTAVQRLKDETRDLKAELRHLAPRQFSMDVSVVDLGRSNSTIDHDRHPSLLSNGENGVEESDKSMATTNHKEPLGPSNNETTMSNVSRMSALSIVGDLLRKVGALELKLVSCRNIVKERQQQQNENNNSSSSAKDGLANNNSNNSGSFETLSSSSMLDHSRRIPRGASTPSLKKIVEQSS